ncbi:thiolase family protein [Raineyella fluvialis]|uniref:Acetyl-CoA C-acyltransferase n=1 Tax=Raineyella fluvialis TaxID=2662261 RepID=A0A5Q2FJR9_9ACTN|nr:thiolase family protein [Raineyella fluvialis]QGF24576.1 acetyl-CoA C-acyltransferase [Raineyella fluvialis]
MRDPEECPVIVDALRTPIGTVGGALRAISAGDLLAPVLAELADHCDAPIDEVVIGNIRGPGGNPARVATLAAGLDVATPAVTIDRQCGSGMAAIEYSVAMLSGPRQGFQIAGGTQSASTQPLTFWPAASPDDEPRQYFRAPFTDAGHADPEMGAAADLLSAEHGIGRERQDAYAARSHQRAVTSADAGAFAGELVPVGGLDRDERPRRGFTTQRLARFRPAFTPEGTATAANSCGVNDGAAAVLICDGRTAARRGLPGLRVLDAVTVGCDPERPGWGIVPAVQWLVERSGVHLDDVDLLDFNEAFAGQVLSCLDALGIDELRNCPQGGAIALGHPWAATGAVQLTRMFTQMVRHNTTGARLGLAAIAIGGGQGSAMLVEAV